RIRQAQPGVTPGVVARLGRRREGRVGERTHGDDDQIRLRRLRVEDLRTAGRAEMKDVLLPVGLVGDPREVAEAAAHLHLLGLESGLHPERAPRATLAGKAVADRDGERIAGNLETKPAAVTRGFAGPRRTNPDRGAFTDRDELLDYVVKWLIRVDLMRTG